MTEEEKKELRGKLCEKKRYAYESLLELAETAEEEFGQSATECEKAERMLEKTMRYGTFADAAKAISLFIDFRHAVDEAELV